MRRFGMRSLPTLLATAVLAGVLPGVALAAGPDDSVELPKMKQPKAVPVKNVAVGGAKRPDAAAANSWRKTAPKVSWPAAGAAEVSLDKGGRAGTLPVSVSAVPTARSAKKAAPAARETVPSKVKVTVAGRDVTQKAGIEGLLLSVHRSDMAKSAAPVPARVTVDYSSFRGAYGGDWAARLRLVQLPACALTTPQLAKCQVYKPLKTTNDIRSGKVTAQAPTTRTLTVLAATADSSGPTGDYKATSLEPSGSWSAGGSTGAFTWSHPIGVPTVPGGLEPKVSLGYSSQAVDGRTAASNNQGSWIGDGWGWEPGFIERRYKPCNDDMTGGTNTTKVGDLCWFTDNATLSLGGKSTELVYQKDKGWVAESDSGEKIEKLTGAVNDDKGTAGADGAGEHWKVTTTDGTQYFFGLNRLPGWRDNGTAADDPVTNSAWTVPVFGNQSGEPCYNSTFASAWCQQAWRWQLDYVVDPHGNAMAYYWKNESNNYGRNVSSTTGKATVTPYDRGGYLERIDYGLRKDTVYTVKPMGQVHFGVSERCLTTCGTFDATNAKNWPDVPFDQYCKDGSTECKDQWSPTFWTRVRLTSITTKVLTGGVHKDVDTWTLAQDFPASGDGISTPMWLKSIQRTGKAGGTITLPAITFAGEQRPNRVDALGDGLAPFIRLRLYQITTETGGTIGVTYSQPDCTATTLPPADDTNATRCYPVKWAYEGETAKQDWFNSYVVTQVVEGDNLVESPDTVSSYSYLGGAAWAKSTDEFTKAENRVHSVARGYGRVQTRTGAASDPRTLEETRFFRGIDGAAVQDSAGAAVTDRPQFAGMVREKATYNGDDTTKLVSATSYTPWRSAAGNTRVRPGLPDLVSYKTGTEKESTRTTVTGGTRTTEKIRHFDGYGMTDWVSETGDTAKPGDEKCTTTTYARNVAAWILDKPSRIETVAVTCGSAVARPGDVIDDIRSYYDGGVLNAAPTRGLVSKRDRINGAGTGYSTVASTPVTDFDIYGRGLSLADAYGKVTTTVYTPATGEVPTSTVVTNPLGHTVTTTLEPLRGQTTQVSDANGKVTSSAYDALGRLIKVWKPTRSAATYPDAPTMAFEYLVRNDGPLVVTTKSLTHDSKYAVSYSFHDGMLRERQTQTESPDRAGRLISETFYDTHGRAWRNSGTFFATGAPEPVLVTGQELKYPASTDTQYDGAGRVTAVISKRFGDETKRTTTGYTGDATTVVPPAGGIAQTTVVDALGRTTELRQYADVARTTAQTTKRMYDKHGRLAEVSDPSGSKWTYKYDVRGRQVEASDPDKGLVTSTYDVGDRITDVRDARGVTLHTDFDEIGRRTALKNGTTTLATWQYDTVAKGQVSKATRWIGADAYESAVLTYNSIYQPVVTQTTIPASEKGLAGTYKWTTSYNANTGQVMWTQHPAIGGLPAEKVANTYSPVAGLLSTVGAGTDPLISETTYDHYGRNAIRKYGAFGQSLTTSNAFDEHTGALTDRYLDREVAPQRIEDAHYAYDPAGNVTSIQTSYGQDTARTTDTQCFDTDALRRVTEAWTDKNAQCSTTPSADVVGGQDAYWTSYTYDAVGNRKTETQHKTDSGPSADTLRTYSAPAVGKHSLPKVTQTGTAPRDEVFTYDAAGNTQTRKVGTAATEAFAWDDEGHLSSVKEGTTDKSSYVYDTDGQRLISRDATGTTLYLSYDTELHLSKSGTVTGTRYYLADGQPLAVRTGAKLVFVFADHHGTGTTQVTADAAQAVTRRKTMLFGARRGAEATGWTGDKGFIGGTEDEATLLIHIGAREYDPSTGRFISVDPVIDLNDPQQAHGYTYGNNNPATYSDPSGRIVAECGTGEIKGCQGGKPAPSKPSGTPAPSGGGNGGDDMVWEALSAGWGEKPADSQRVLFNVGRGPNRGVIRLTFYIHTEKALLGFLLGDDREMSQDPHQPYRMSLIWNTETGDCSFTVTASETAEKKATSTGLTWHPTVPSARLPARQIEVGAYPSDTNGGFNVVNYEGFGHESTSEQLDLGVHAVNSYIRVFAVDNHVKIKATKTSVTVTRSGDAYPDMEVVQYRSNHSPRTIATDSMASESGYDSMPGYPGKIDKAWTDNVCVKGCR
ncbi:RHS repeat-associated core domain-containing protein [Streptomyces sp. NPDC006307]|uniref:RHS repeat-associated core domain-containing protein n=1 Tax=Streptomyces sp. NPDC006307 TaxID=3156748 RepID=UPI0033A35EFD